MFRLGQEGESCQNCLWSENVLVGGDTARKHTSDYGWKPHLVLPLLTLLTLGLLSFKLRATCKPLNNSKDQQAAQRTIHVGLIL